MNRILISIPHLFAGKADIEIAGFLTALIAWGQRPVILRNARQWMQRMDDRPGEFMVNHSLAERKKFGDFVHRTMNGEDAIYLLKALQKTYRDEGGLEGLFSNNFAASGKSRPIHLRHPPATAELLFSRPYRQTSRRPAA